MKTDSVILVIILYMMKIYMSKLMSEYCRQILLVVRSVTTNRWCAKTNVKHILTINGRNHGGIVVKHLFSTSVVCRLNPGPYAGKLVVAYRWWTVYSTEP